MTPANEQTVRNWILAKVPQYGCPFCGATQKWAISEVVMPALANDPRAGIPMVAVMCRDCARYDLFDAVAVGLLPPFA
jgi:hypothetical protein